MPGEEQISNNLITLVSASTMSSLRSGNTFMDMALSLLFIIMLPIIIKWVKNISFGWSFSNEDCYSVKLVGETRQTKNGFLRHSYSETFSALTKYIETQDNVKSLSEFCIGSYNDKSQYIPHNTDYLKLTDTIFCVINHRSPEEGQGSKIYITLKSHKSLREIQDFLSIVLSEYHNRMSEELEKSKKYFCPNVEDEILRWTVYNFESNKNMDNMYFDEKDKILKNIDHFTKNKELYQRLGIPWTLGILLHGPPGCGKSSFVKALANYTERHIIEVPLNRIKTYGALRKVMLGPEIADYKIPFEKRLYLMEDIDCLDTIVLSRKKKEKENVEEKEMSNLKSSYFSNKDPLTLSHILNIIDGPLEAPGRMLIITSNHPEKLDEALVRDGRMDIKLEMKPIDGKSLCKMIKTFFPDEEIPLLRNSRNRTPASVQNLCFTKPFEEICEALS